MAFFQSQLRASVSLGTLLVICLVFAGPIQAQKYGKVTDAEWAMGAPANEPDANAIVIFSNGVLDVVRGHITTERHVRIKVLNKAGIEDVGDWSFSYNKNQDDVREFKAQTITPDGKKHKVHRSDTYEKSVGHWKTRTFSFPAVDSGCILEFKYRIRSSQYVWLDPWYFQTRLYTVSSRFAIILAPGFSYAYDFTKVPVSEQVPVEESLANPEATVRQIAPLKKYTWTVTNLPSITYEPYMSCLEDNRASLKFQLTGYSSSSYSTSFLRTWVELGEAVEDEFETYHNADDKVRELAEQITANAATDEEKSRALYDYVVNTYGNSHEYQAFYVGNNSEKDLLKNQRGTPEEKNLLLVTLHRAIGLEAFPVFISTRDHARFNPRFPSFQWFNYMIAFIHLGNRWILADTRSAHVPYDLLPPDCLTDGGLLVDGDKSQLVRITILQNVSRRIDMTDMYISHDGSVACTTSSEFRGYLASSYGSSFDASVPKDFIDATYLDRLGTSCVLDTFTCALDTANCFNVQVDYTADDLVRRLENNLLVRPVSYTFHSNPFASEERHCPVDFTYPFRCVNIVHIYADSQCTLLLPPRDTTLTAGGLVFQRQSLFDGESLVITSTIDIKQAEFPVVQYDGLRSFFEQVAMLQNDEVDYTIAEAR